MKLILLLAASLAALALPGSAFAGSCAPPGNSGVDQYFETVPGAGCNQPPGGHHHHGKGLSRTTNSQLAAQGSAGKAVQNLVASSGTAGISSGGGSGTLPSSAGTSGAPSNGHGASGGKQATQATHASAPSAGGRSLISALLHPILSGSNSGGLGILLPLLLAAVLVLALGRLLLRRRRLSS